MNLQQKQGRRRVRRGVRAIKYHFNYGNDPFVNDLLAGAGVTITPY